MMGGTLGLVGRGSRVSWSQGEVLMELSRIWSFMLQGRPPLAKERPPLRGLAHLEVIQGRGRSLGLLVAVEGCFRVGWRPGVILHGIWLPGCLGGPLLAPTAGE